MNIFTSFRGFFSKTISATAIVAVVGMYAQPILVAQAAVAAPGLSVTLNGANPFYVTVGTPFVDPGATVNSDPGEFASGIQQDIWSVDTSTLGTTTITYSANECPTNGCPNPPSTTGVDATASVTRTVVVIPAPLDITSVAANSDINVTNGTTFANIPLPATTTVTLSDSSTTTLPVVWSQGSYDGTTANTYALSGALTLSGPAITNTNNVESSVNVIVAPATSTTATSTTSTASSTPTITLIGSSVVNLYVGDTFNDPGVTTASGDPVNGYLSGVQQNVWSVDTSAPGTTTIVYTVLQCSANNCGSDPTTITGSASTTRTVVVNAGVNPNPTTPIVCGPTDTTTTVVSDTTNIADGSTPAVAVSTPYNTNWTASIPGATWIWDVDPIVDETATSSATFTKTFTLNGVTDGAQMNLAADNSFTASINGHVIGVDSTQYNYTAGTQHTYTVDPSWLVDGTNTLSFTVTNFSLNPLPYPNANPAGLLYSFTACVAPAPVTPPTIALIGNNPLTVTQGTPFIDPGATASDTVSGDLTSSIAVTGGNGGSGDSIDTSAVGSTILTYTVTDATTTLSASTTREVDVVAAGSGPTGPSTSTPAYTCATSSVETTYVSDTSTLSGSNDSVELSYINPAWTASIPTASWIWNTDDNYDPTQDLTVAFDKDITILGTTTAAKIDIAADNNYAASINSTMIGSDSSGGTFSSATQQEYSIDPSLFVKGVNDLAFTVTNLGAAGVTDPHDNPAGLLYKVTVCSDPVPAPTIALNGNNPMVVTVGTTFSDPGATASDTESGDLTGDIVITGGNSIPGGNGAINTSAVGTTSITYTVTDATTTLSASTTREVDIVPDVPVITLLGANPLQVTVGTSFTDPGATASDTASGDLTSDIVVTGGNASTTGTIDTSAIGTTSLTYTVTDATTTLSASTTREVDVVAAGGTNPVNPPSPQIIFSGGGGGGGIGGAVALGGNASTTIAGSLSCPFMTGYVIPGRIANILAGATVNDPAQISKLQVFLNAYEGDSAVSVTGVLDQPTINGILAFQQKYLTDTMGPWNANAPSGNVYITTLREINALVCGPQPSLTPAQQAVINTYLAEVAAGNANGTTTNGGANNNQNNGSSTPSTSTGSTTGSIGSTASTTNGVPNNSLLTGNVVSSGAGSFFSSLFSKFFSFFGIK